MVTVPVMSATMKMVMSESVVVMIVVVVMRMMVCVVVTAVVAAVVSAAVMSAAARVGRGDGQDDRGRQCEGKTQDPCAHAHCKAPFR